MCIERIPYIKINENPQDLLYAKNNIGLDYIIANSNKNNHTELQDFCTHLFLSKTLLLTCAYQ